MSDPCREQTMEVGQAPPPITHLMKATALTALYMSSAPTPSEITLNPQIRGLPLKKKIEQSHQKPSSELLRKEKNPGSGLRVGISKALWKCDSTGAGSPRSVCAPENTCLMLATQGCAWETLSHGAYVYMTFLLK